MPKPDDLPGPEDLAASLRRAIDGRKTETVYNSAGAPIAVLVPVAERGSSVARDQFVQLLRELRDGDPDVQRCQWEQLEEVLSEGRLPEQSP
jgi:hypothetical protein